MNETTTGSHLKWWVYLSVVGLLFLAACGSNTSEAHPHPSVSGVSSSDTSTTMEPSGGDETGEKESSNEDVDGEPDSEITFEAWLVSEGGTDTVKLQMTSALPAGSDVWAILINGNLTTRTNDIPGSIIGINVTPFVDVDGPVSVSVRAETDDHEVIVAAPAPIKLR